MYCNKCLFYCLVTHSQWWPKVSSGGTFVQYLLLMTVQVHLSSKYENRKFTGNKVGYIVYDTYNQLLICHWSSLLELSWKCVWWYIRKKSVTFLMSISLYHKCFFFFILFTIFKHILYMFIYCTYLNWIFLKNCRFDAFIPNSQSN